MAVKCCQRGKMEVWREGDTRGFSSARQGNFTRGKDNSYSGERPSGSFGFTPVRAACARKRAYPAAGVNVDRSAAYLGRLGTSVFFFFFFFFSLQSAWDAPSRQAVQSEPGPHRPKQGRHDETYVQASGCSGKTGAWTCGFRGQPCRRLTRSFRNLEFDGGGVTDRTAGSVEQLDFLVRTVRPRLCYAGRI